ncbi:unnamed protein product [Ambrosiozyma monospora]|uniref:Unnamed protein product n=1 Tax=Ambrosiozyma monospora TaxID=43982 RepID=A0ACB5TTY4_AMBMO|nr:unnamed protein product [Ambrosiozyma monospora]
MNTSQKLSLQFSQQFQSQQQSLTDQYTQVVLSLPHDIQQLVLAHSLSIVSMPKPEDLFSYEREFCFAKPYSGITIELYSPQDLSLKIGCLSGSLKMTCYELMYFGAKLEFFSNLILKKFIVHGRTTIGDTNQVETLGNAVYTLMARFHPLDVVVKDVEFWAENIISYRSYITRIEELHEISIEEVVSDLPGLTNLQCVTLTVNESFFHFDALRTLCEKLKLVVLEYWGSANLFSKGEMSELIEEYSNIKIKTKRLIPPITEQLTLFKDVNHIESVNFGKDYIFD